MEDYPVMPKSNMKFWVVLVMAMLFCSALILMIDISIKAAILEESVQLRKVIEEAYNERAREEKQPARRDNPDSSVNGHFHSDVLPVVLDARPDETSSFAAGDKAKDPPRRRTRPVPKRDTEIPGGNE